MFVIYGQVNSGKTHTMWLVLNHLIENEDIELEDRNMHMHGSFLNIDNVLNSPGEIPDFHAIVRNRQNGRRIAIWSAGDSLNHPSYGFRRYMRWAEENGVDFIVCTSRSQDREGSIFHELRTVFRNDINWWERVDRKQSANWLTECDEHARRIAEKLLEVIG